MRALLANLALAAATASAQDAVRPDPTYGEREDMEPLRLTWEQKWFDANTNAVLRQLAHVWPSRVGQKHTTKTVTFPPTNSVARPVVTYKTRPWLMHGFQTETNGAKATVTYDVTVRQLKRADNRLDAALGTASNEVPVIDRAKFKAVRGRAALSVADAEPIAITR